MKLRSVSSHEKGSSNSGVNFSTQSYSQDQDRHNKEHPLLYETPGVTHLLMKTPE